MNEASKSFLKSAYKEYYFRGSDSIEFPDDIGSREFGYIPFGGGMVRHLGFRNRGEAVAEILKQSPSSVYCSNARYEYPTRPIEEKGWLGAELIFDIDATDIPTPCKRSHDVWFCDKCRASGKLPRPAKCPKCGGSTEEFHGTCEVCLAAAKEHTSRLLRFLADDFGVPDEAVRVYFSGNRGYHLQVYDERFALLDQLGRSEIAEYVRGSSLPLSQTIASTLRRTPQGGGPQGRGWTRRITGYVDERRQTFEGTLQKLVSEAVSTQRALVDSSVTTDIHRVFRLAGTLHGNTGMAKTRVRSLETFDPQRDPVVLTGQTVKLAIGYFPRFSIKGKVFGSYKSETAELPAYAAVSILTRGLGEVE
ncbi:MAG TPA: DNA primase small subunit domain-containing protein [Nitrososphaerales archaeon]|nr:DNA primase small subunit domain-containing protein [Nitrososphaerales archaeon]